MKTHAPPPKKAPAPTASTTVRRFQQREGSEGARFNLLNIPAHAPARTSVSTNADAPVATSAPASALEQPASDAARVSAGTAMRPRSLLDIPIHAPITSDARATGLARAAQARAVTIGRNIYIPPAAFHPETAVGRELIAHEQVHVAQSHVGMASGESAEASAEAEARALAPRIATGGWSGISVTRPAVPMMRDKLPEQDLSEDRDQIRTTLEQRNPWLQMLTNREQIEKEFVERIVLTRQSASTQRALQKLPNARATYASDEIERRERLRAPSERKLEREAVALSKHSAWVKINIQELISPEMRQQAQQSSGAAAVLHELRNYQGWVGLDANGLDSFRFGLTVQYGGQWVPVEADGIHLKGFWADAVLSYPNAAVRQAYYAASAQQLHGLMEQWVDTSPGLAAEQLRKYIEEQEAAENPPDRPLSAEEREIADYESANKAYAETIRQKTEQAVQPLIFIASLFEIDGPIDLLLAVMPVDKIGAKLFSLGKDAIKSRRARKLEQLLAKEFGHLDEEAKGFVKLARAMSKSEVRALKTINEAAQSHTLIVALMKRSIAETADLKWIAKQLEKGRIDANFIRGFTKAESGPAWNVFEDIVEGRKVADKTRNSLASKVTGFLGEQAAEKLVKTESFAKSMLGGRVGAKVEQVLREVPYRGGKSLDLVAISEKSELIIGEVKHWSTETWMTDSKKVLDQLDRHNAGILEVAKAMSRRASDVKKKVLFVSANGFNGVDKLARNKIIAAVESRGWVVERIRDSDIETFGNLIDRLR